MAVKKQRVTFKSKGKKISFMAKVPKKPTKKKKR